MEEEELIDVIYNMQEEGCLAELSKEEKDIINRMKLTENENLLNNEIDKIEDETVKQTIKKLLKLTLEDVSEKNSATLKKYYKTGFKSGVRFLIEGLS